MPQRARRDDGLQLVVREGEPGGEPSVPCLRPPTLTNVAGTDRQPPASRQLDLDRDSGRGAPCRGCVKAGFDHRLIVVQRHDQAARKRQERERHAGGQQADVTPEAAHRDHGDSVSRGNDGADSEEQAEQPETDDEREGVCPTWPSRNDSSLHAKRTEGQGRRDVPGPLRDWIRIERGESTPRAFAPHRSPRRSAPGRRAARETGRAANCARVRGLYSRRGIGTLPSSSLSSVGFRLGEWLVDPSTDRVQRDGQSRSLQPKFMQLLTFLAEHKGEVVSRERIFDQVWEKHYVADGTLRHAIAVLRQTLGDDVHNPRYIETISTKGYRLIADVGELSDRRRRSRAVGNVSAQRLRGASSVAHGGGCRRGGRGVRALTRPTARAHRTATGPALRWRSCRSRAWDPATMPCSWPA